MVSKARRNGREHTYSDADAFSHGCQACVEDVVGVVGVAENSGLEAVVVARGKAGDGQVQTPTLNGAQTSAHPSPSTDHDHHPHTPSTMLRALVNRELSSSLVSRKKY